MKKDHEQDCEHLFHTGPPLQRRMWPGNASLTLLPAVSVECVLAYPGFRTEKHTVLTTFPSTLICFTSNSRKHQSAFAPPRLHSFLTRSRCGEVEPASRGSRPGAELRRPTGVFGGEVGCQKDASMAIANDRAASHSRMQRGECQHAARLHSMAIKAPDPKAPWSKFAPQLCAPRGGWTPSTYCSRRAPRPVPRAPPDSAGRTTSQSRPRRTPRRCGPAACRTTSRRTWRPCTL